MRKNRELLIIINISGGGGGTESDVKSTITENAVIIRQEPCVSCLKVCKLSLYESPLLPTEAAN